MNLRERTRNAVRAELTVVAQQLFVERGYEATTVDAVAEAAGTSKRSFFRYFGSKEELVLGKYDLIAEQIVEALRARPSDESPWEALRRAFDGIAGYMDDPARHAGAQQMQRIVQDTPTLRAGYLERFDRMVEGVARALQDRRGASADGAADLRSRAVVAAAFACLQVADHAYVNDTRTSYASHLDQAMAALQTTDRTTST